VDGQKVRPSFIELPDSSYCPCKMSGEQTAVTLQHEEVHMPHSSLQDMI